jgi:hypothetical protein
MRKKKTQTRHLWLYECRARLMNTRQYNIGDWSEEDEISTIKAVVNAEYNVLGSLLTLAQYKSRGKRPEKKWKSDLAVRLPHRPPFFSPQTSQTRSPTAQAIITKRAPIHAIPISNTFGKRRTTPFFSQAQIPRFAHLYSARRNDVEHAHFPAQPPLHARRLDRKLPAHVRQPPTRWLGTRATCHTSRTRRNRVTDFQHYAERRNGVWRRQCKIEAERG